jgi:hypothetical protein
MLTTKHGRRASARFNAAMFAIPVVLLFSAVVHNSWTLGWSALTIAGLMAAFTVIGRFTGETGRFLTGRVDDERNAEIQIRAWANVGQVLMVLFVAMWLIRIVMDGDGALRGALQWIWLLAIGALVGAGTVGWLQRRS